MTGSAKWKAVAEAIAGAEAKGAAIGVALRGAEGDFDYQGDNQFVAASTVKVPLMVALYRRIDAGTLSLNQKVTLTRDLVSPGSGVLLHMSDGLVPTINDLIYLMISISDNTATNILIDMAGMDEVNKTMRSLKMTSSNLGRKMKGRAAQGDEIENLATADDYALVIEAILDGTAASPQSCERMADMLRKQQNRRRIARFVPESRDYDWGTKTGSVTNVANDVGFVKRGDNRMILSLFTSGFPLQVDAEEAMGLVARAALQAGGILPRRK